MVELFASPGNFTATVENLDDAVLLIEIEPGRGRCRPAAWLSLYGDAGREAPAWQERIRSVMAAAFSG